MLHLSPECGAQGRADERLLQTLPPSCARCPAGLTGTSQDTLESRTGLPGAGRGRRPGCLVWQLLAGAVQDLGSPLGSPHPPLCLGAAQLSRYGWPPTPGVQSGLGYGSTGRTGSRGRDPDAASPTRPGGRCLFPSPFPLFYSIANV